MKNKIVPLITIISSLTLVGCNKQNYMLDLKVATPSGSPATAFYKHLGETNYLEVNGDANNVIAYLTTTDSSKKKDIVVAPTNAGIGAINQGADFQIAANITFGNFYILSTGLDIDGEMNEGDKVWSFQQNGVAGKLFNYIYGGLGLDVTYKKDGAAVKNDLELAGFDAAYVMLAQPAVAAVLKSKTDFRIYQNMQEKYREKSGGKEITQASIFVRKDTDKEKVNKFLSNIKSDVEELLANPDVLSEATSDIEDEIFSGKMQGTKALITNLIKNNNMLGIGYKDALENKASIDAFIANFGMGATSEEIYFSYNK